MSFTASHIGFVLGSYAISAIVIIGLIVMHIARSRKNDRRLNELDGDKLRQSTLETASNQ